MELRTNIQQQQQRDHGCGDAPCCICCRHSPNKPAKEEEEATLFQRQLKRSLPFFYFPLIPSPILLVLSLCQPICSSIGHVRIRSSGQGQPFASWSNNDKRLRFYRRDDHTCLLACMHSIFVLVSFGLCACQHMYNSVLQYCLHNVVVNMYTV